MNTGTSDIVSVTAVAPGKAILFGEHAINRGQAALATAVGIRATCRVVRRAEGYRFHSGARSQTVSRAALLDVARRVGQWREVEDFPSIRALARDDYFAPQKYVLGAGPGDALPGGLELEWQSDVPPSSGLGSGGSAFTAMVAAVTALLGHDASLQERADWARLGDVVAHGGIASALDTQTSLLGGVIRFTGQGLASRLTVAPGFSLVIGNTGVAAATGEVNGRVREWLAERPRSRMAYFQTVGALSRAAEPLLERGEWSELGKLMNLNQLVLEKIGVSSPQIEGLIDAALDAGAFGAKISGSGGGGIIVALVSEETKQPVADAIAAAGGTALLPEVAVEGVRVTEVVKGNAS